MNNTLKVALTSLFTLFSASTLADKATCVNLSPYEAVKIEVTGKNGFLTGDYNISARGWGAHFAGGLNNDGYGSADAECHLIPGEDGGSLVAGCYDGYVSQSQHQNEFTVALGSLRHWENKRALLQSVTWFVTRREVKMIATRLAVNRYNNEAHPYLLETVFPMRESSGFWKNNQFCYSANGILNSTAGNFTGNTNGNRIGSGYVMNVTFIKPQP